MAVDIVFLLFKANTSQLFHLPTAILTNLSLPHSFLVRRDFSAASETRTGSREDVRFDALTCTVTPLSQQSDDDDTEPGKGGDHMELANISAELVGNGGSMHNMMAGGDLGSLSSTSTTGDHRPALITGAASAGQVRLEDRDPGSLMAPAESKAAEEGEPLEGLSVP